MQHVAHQINHADDRLIRFAAQAQPQQLEAAASAPPSFMGPCSTLSACEIQNDWTRNNVLVYLLAGRHAGQQVQLQARSGRTEPLESECSMWRR